MTGTDPSENLPGAWSGRSGGGNCDCGAMAGNGADVTTDIAGELGTVAGDVEAEIRGERSGVRIGDGLCVDMSLLTFFVNSVTLGRDAVSVPLSSDGQSPGT